MILAVEDLLSEVVAKKIIASTRSDIHVNQVIGRKGSGHLRNKAAELNRVARSQPVFILADSDSLSACPIELVSTWLGGRKNKMLIFRFVVTEIESWVLADRLAFAKFFSILYDRIPQSTDNIRNPKEFLINLVRRSRSKKIKNDLLPKLGATTKVGPGYNTHLIDFVTNNWDAGRAASSSASLDKTIRKIREFSY